MDEKPPPPCRVWLVATELCEHAQPFALLNCRPNLLRHEPAFITAG